MKSYQNGTFYIPKTMKSLKLTRTCEIFLRHDFHQQPRAARSNQPWGSVALSGALSEELSGALSGALSGVLSEALSGALSGSL